MQYCERLGGVKNMSSVKAVAALGYIDEKRGLITEYQMRFGAWRNWATRRRICKALAKALEDEGFIFRLGVGGMPSGLEAAWGFGRQLSDF